MFSKNNKQAGFSLVELMVVVAIIGILASIAIPSVNKYMAKARQSEAKTNLASLYTAEKAFFSEYNSYDSRFEAVGFSPEGGLRYNVGFGAAGIIAGANVGFNVTGLTAAWFNTVAYCGTNGAYQRGCTTLRGATGAVPPALATSYVTAQNTFIAGATAQIQSSSTRADTWTMNENKQLQNVSVGIQ